MKRTLSMLLIAALLLSLAPFAAAESPKEAPKLEINQDTLDITVKFRTNVSEYIQMSDDSELPSDLKFKLKNTKYASISKRGVVTGKKPGAVTFTASSASLRQSVSCKLYVRANSWKSPISPDARFAELRAMNPYHWVYGWEDKLYFKNGKLTVELIVANNYGHNIKKINNLYVGALGLDDDDDGWISLGSYRKANLFKGTLKHQKWRKFTFSFSKKGLDKKVNLTNVYEETGKPCELILEIHNFDTAFDGPANPWPDEEGFEWNDGTPEDDSDE